MRAVLRFAAIDLDGTLVDSAPDLTYCLGAAFSQFSLPAPDEAHVRSFIGDGVANLVARAMAHAQKETKASPPFDEVFAAFLESYKQNNYVRSKLYEDVPAVLANLRDAGLRLGCVTNKRGDFTEDLLEKSKLRGYFDVVIAGDSLPVKKPEPGPLIAAAEAVGIAAAQSVMIGDSTHDASAAQAAGFAFVWATYGYCPKIDPLPPRTLASISRFVELRAVLGA